MEINDDIKARVLEQMDRIKQTSMLRIRATSVTSQLVEIKDTEMNRHDSRDIKAAGLFGKSTVIEQKSRSKL